MMPAIIADIAELRSQAAIVRLACGCDALVTDYVPRRAFSHRYHENHELAVVSHVSCNQKHGCGQTQPDGQHRGVCGPVGPEKPLQPVCSPTPDSPPAIVRQPVRKPARPLPAALACGVCGANMALDPFHACPSQPVPDDDGAWAGLLDTPQPVLARR